MIDRTDLPWHSLKNEEVVEKTGTSIKDGLTSSEVAIRRERFGPNNIAQKKRHSPLKMFINQFRHPLMYILIVAGIVIAVLEEWVDAGVVFGVVLINSVVGYVQEDKAQKAIEALFKAVISEATVIRDSKKQRINALDLTIGDIVMLQSGDRVPADLRLLQVRDLQLAEAALTGESLPVHKFTEALSTDTILADRSNMAYSSTLVTYGTGTGVVTAVGNDTEIGRINRMIASAVIIATPLTRQIARFSKLLLYVIIGLAAITFIAGTLQGEPAIYMFLAAVSLAVALIPEGLPAAMTITLAIGVSKMARRHAIIRKLPAVETLGSVTVVCSDKTGTLTQNQMTVQEIHADGKLFEVTGVGYAPQGEIELSGEVVDVHANTALRGCLTAGLLCNEANLIPDGDVWRVEGDPTEAALITAARKAGLTRDELLQGFPRIDAIPFESHHMYMATLHHDVENNKNVIYMKGSVEKVLERCSGSMTTTGHSGALDAEQHHRLADAMARKGLRILAFACRTVESGKKTIVHDDVSGGMTFLGLQAMIDPPRPEAVSAVKACHDAGIKVKMITGDHEVTALAIAQRIGILQSGDDDRSPVLNGKAIAALSDEELAAQVRKVSVFARVAPEDKLRIVKALQANGESVAMTGDGVNDAPSLKQANIGVAMGITGTDVAKETADMILTDDNFATIEAAVEEGRGVFDNLTKFITWTLPTNLGQGMVIMVAVVLGTILPILPVQVLWINMTTAVLLGLMLAFEPKEPGIMNRSPRQARKPILTGLLSVRIVIVGAMLCAAAFVLFHMALDAGASEASARTIAVNTIAIGQLFYLFNCRSLHQSMFKIGLFSNRLIIVGVTLMVLAQVAFTYLPFMNTAFHSEPISFVEWGYCVGVGLFIYISVEIEKVVRKRFLQSIPFFRG
jgi:cation-transporting ATPase F